MFGIRRRGIPMDWIMQPHAPSKRVFRLAICSVMLLFVAHSAAARDAALQRPIGDFNVAQATLPAPPGSTTNYIGQNGPKDVMTAS